MRTVKDRLWLWFLDAVKDHHFDYDEKDSQLMAVVCAPSRPSQLKAILKTCM